MKWLATADVHLEKKLFNIPELGEDLFSAFELFAQKAIELKVDAVLLVGDLYETQRPMDRTVVFVNGVLEKLRKAKIEVVGISGDHDKAVQDKTWIEHVNGVKHPMSLPEFAGAHYVDFFNLSEFLTKLPAAKKATVEWLMFHGISPIVFPHSEPKKTLDFTQCRLSDLPKLKGIILGDLHKPEDFSLQQSAKAAPIPISYCGSLGVTKTPEAFNKIGLLYWDGAKLSRVPFPPARVFSGVEITSAMPIILTEDLMKIAEANKAKKPVFVVKYEQSQKDKLKDLAFLEKVAFVRTSLIHEEPGEQELVNIRSELSTQERIDAALKECCKDDESVYVLGTELLTSTDPKGILDKFKQQSFTNAQKSPV